MLQSSKQNITQDTVTLEEKRAAYEREKEKSNTLKGNTIPRFSV